MVRFPVLGVFSLSLRWAKTCLTRWQHCFHSLFCLLLAHLCLKLCPHWPLHLPARIRNTGHLFLRDCAEQYNMNVDLQVLVTQNCPKETFAECAVSGSPQDVECWTNLGIWPLPLGGGASAKETLNPSSGVLAWPWAGHLTFLGLSLSSVIHKGSLLILLPLESLGSVCFNKRGTCHG